MKKGLTEVVFILDKSGSMSGLESDTIGGYNSFLLKHKDLEDECLITTVLFDHEYEILHDRINIKEISPIGEKEYCPEGLTALLDAIGRTINKVKKNQENTNKVMFVIITDGEENSSREYSYNQIKAMIEEQKEGYGWEFIFLAANMDAVETAGNIGIEEDRAVTYLSDSEGTQLNYQVMSDAVKKYRESGSVDEDSLDDIRMDFKRRGSKK